MPIRLIRISKELNVGISTLVDFLQKKGHAVEGNPNTRIDDELCNTLIAEFGKDKKLKLESNREKELKREKRIENVVAIQGYEDKQPEKPKQAEKPQPKPKPQPEPQEKSEEQAPVKETKSQIQVLGSIDLDSLKKEAQPKEKETRSRSNRKRSNRRKKAEAEKTEKATPNASEQKTVAPEPAETTETAAAPAPEKKEAEVFRINHSQLKPHLTVKGTIDLSAINDKTRPDKKTRSERRKEHEDRHGKKPKTDQQTPKTDANTATSTSAPDAAKKKRKRIKKGKVDLEKGLPTASTEKTAHQRSADRNQRRKPAFAPKAQPTEEEVAKQIKETLAQLTRGQKTKTSKHKRERREREEAIERQHIAEQKLESKLLKITEFVTVNDLANMMNVPVTSVIKTCMDIGQFVSINQRLDAEIINLVAEEFGFKTEYVSAEVSQAITEEEDNEEDLLPRSPIVTVMGHVDHGKTSLLDNIRKTNVIAGEAGGITQHIGAYNVKLPNGRRITFLDTPGHAAFTAMRARGAKVTDIAIIIVAADDNVMPQTIEAINHAAAAGVPIVFAINKIDKPGANPEKIKEALAQMNYLVEEWGGSYQSQDISAKQGIGVKELLEKVLLQADILELKANPNKKAVGSIIESSLDKGRGFVSTVLIENGTLKKGDIVLAGTYYGRVKAMFNERNAAISEAAPAEPALILGLNGAPTAGDRFNVLDSEQEAREIANKREQLAREQGLRTRKLLTLDDIGRRIAIGNFQELNIIVKGDVDGSIEALSDALIRLSTPEIQVNVIHKAVGEISETDIMLAATSNAIVVGFQVRPSLAARRAAEKEGVEIRLYSVIYDATEEVKAAMEGMLSPEIKEEITANVEVRELFKIPKIGTVAGCMVKDGKIKRTNKIRLIRDGIVIYQGELGSLKRFKDDVKEVASGYECGLNIANYNDVKIGDIVEAFEEIEVKKTL